MKISLIHPSRGRPEKARSTYDYWMAQASGEVKIEYILSLDISDHTKQQYKGFRLVVAGDNDCVVQATNRAAKHASGDVLFYLSDDFKCPRNWDALILNKMTYFGNVQTYEGEQRKLLRVNDGHQPFENFILTIPIMNRALYSHLGYFFNPIYKSQWCDCDLYATTKEYILNAPELLFPHIEGPDDDTYRHNRAEFENGRAIFEKRQKEFGWPNPFNRQHLTA